MHRNPRLFRLTATVALTALLWDAVLPVIALAQPAPPPLPPAPGQPEQNQADPPARVGRIAAITGTASFHNPGDTQWSPASVNYPVSAGNAFWTEPSAQIQLQVSDSRIGLAGGTEFDIYSLDQTGLQGVAVQGEIYLHLRDLSPDEAWSVQTPRGLAHLGGGGRYNIVVGSTDQPTLITVIDGSAQIEGPNVSLQLAAGQTATLTGTDTFEGSVGPAQQDAFLTERLNAERPAPPPPGVPAQVAVMPGGSDLYRVGDWTDAPDYGRVWYPPVAQGWVPYRQGHWAYVAPWGWTWIDDAPWGFAPFHYGRWVEIGGRWAWTPGAAAIAGPPVYAPALVTFIGIGAGVAIGAALASRSVGWVPLGPREPFRPWYHASDRYVRDVNIRHVTNVTNITNTNATINNYVNRRAATSIPAAAMAGSRPVQAVARPVNPQEFAQARPIFGQQPLRPSAATAGVTPVVARQLNLAPAPMAVQPAPGPAVRAQAGGPRGPAFVRPALLPTGGTTPAASGQPAPGAPTRPGFAPPGARSEPGATPNRQGGPTPGMPGAATDASAPNLSGRPVPGGQPVPAGPPNGAAPVHPAVPATVPVPGARPVPGVAPNPAVPMHAGGPATATQPVSGSPPSAFQPNHPPGGPPPSELLSRHPGGPGAGGFPPATGARPMTPQAVPHPAPAPGPAFAPLPAPAPLPAANGMPHPVPQGAPALRPEPHVAAPPPTAPHFNAPAPMAPHATAPPPAAPHFNATPPTAPHFAAPAPAPMAVPHPAPQVAPAARPEPHFAAPPPAMAPHVAPPPAAAPHFAAPPPAAAPHFAPPPQPAARPAPQPQPQGHPAPAGHEKRPGER